MFRTVLINAAKDTFIRQIIAFRKIESEFPTGALWENVYFYGQ